MDAKRILIAPNAFKNSLPADEVADALREGILQTAFKGTVVCCPVGDGGDGTGKLLRRHFNAEEMPCETVDALQRPIGAGFGMTNNKTAIIELADASGLRLLKRTEYDPLHANTIGTGKLIRDALDAGAKKLILCIGGSATVDGGSGLLQELGLIFRDDSGNPIGILPFDLARLAAIDSSGLDKRLQQIEITILCDVKNKLLGKSGAAAVFGPQKGANESDVKYLENCLAKLDDVVFKTTQKRMSKMPHSGAAGGVAAALCAFCNANAVDGISTFLKMTGFEEQVKNADLVITGEGAMDRQTLDGKAPYGVAVAAKKFNVPVIAVAGKVSDEDNTELKQYFHKLIGINPPGIDLQKAIRKTREHLIETGRVIGQRYLNS